VRVALVAGWSPLYHTQIWFCDCVESNTQLIAAAAAVVAAFFFHGSYPTNSERRYFT